MRPSPLLLIALLILCVALPAQARALYIVQIWCPAETSMEHWRTMDDILNSVRITTQVPSVATVGPSAYRSNDQSRPSSTRF